MKIYFREDFTTDNVSFYRRGVYELVITYGQRVEFKFVEQYRRYRNYADEETQSKVLDVLSARAGRSPVRKFSIPIRG